MNHIQEILQACRSILSEPFRTEYGRLFEEEHLTTLATQLLNFYENGVPERFPHPYFEVECTPPLSEAFSFFKDALITWDAQGRSSSPEILQKFADALATAPCRYILILMGQRLTPASITDARAIPPTRKILMDAATSNFNDELTIVARAWTKHAHRSSEKFWGKVKGTTAEKNQFAAKLIGKILNKPTWWNVFGHYRWDTIYEVRVATGHGARWGNAGSEFIGFVEPFDPESGAKFEIGENK